MDTFPLIDLIVPLISQALYEHRRDLIIYLHPRDIERMKGVQFIEGFPVLPTQHKRWRVIVGQSSTTWAYCVGDNIRDMEVLESGVQDE